VRRRDTVFGTRGDGSAGTLGEGGIAEFVLVEDVVEGGLFLLAPQLCDFSTQGS
jgi:hypothetical protein